MAFKDRRRTDARDNLQGIPFIMTSAEIDIADITTVDTVLFSFPNANETYIVTQMWLDVITDFNAAITGIDVGSIATDDAAESGTLTAGTEYWATADGDETSGTVFQVATTADLSLAPLVIVGAVTTVPVIYADVDAAATGKFRVHILVTAIPSY